MIIDQSIREHFYVLAPYADTRLFERFYWTVWISKASVETATILALGAGGQWCSTVSGNRIAIGPKAV